MNNRTGFLCIYSVVSIFVIIAAVVFGYKFLPAAEFGDGFSAQLLTASALVNDGISSGVVDESWLPFLHVVRLVVVTPFLAIEAAIGPAGPVALLLLLLLPLTRTPNSIRRSILVVSVLFLPLVISGRSMLVALSVGYIVMYILERRRPWMLWVGALLTNLSSASVLVAILIMATVDVNNTRGYLSRHQKLQNVVVFFLLTFSLGLSSIDKFSGFSTSEIGYATHAFDSDNVLLQIISRSTLAVSIYEGQYFRAVAYGIVAVFLVVKLFTTLSDSRNKTARRIVICCVPGIFLEGLGVWAMFFPIIWLLPGFSVGKLRLPHAVRP